MKQTVSITSPFDLVGLIIVKQVDEVVNCKFKSCTEHKSPLLMNAIVFKWYNGTNVVWKWKISVQVEGKRQG